MKRIIEKRNLAFNYMMNLCDLCKRCKGFRESNDDLYDCKYNTDNKGLHDGLVSRHMQNFKCKYFKRHQKYRTCKMQSKLYTSTTRTTTKEVRYIKGKFKIKTNLKK